MRIQKKTVFTILVFLTAGLFFGYTIGSFYESNDRSDKIIEILKENCDCKEINQTIYAKGVQFGSNGISTEKGEYQLIDCNFSISMKEESKRLNEILKRKVNGFENVDILELEFVNSDKNETVIIKNGKIQ